MARTTEEAEELLTKELDKDIEDGTDEDLKEEAVEEPEDAGGPEALSEPEDAAEPEAVSEPEDVSGAEDATDSEDTNESKDVTEPEDVNDPEDVTEPEETDGSEEDGASEGSGADEPEETAGKPKTAEKSRKQKKKREKVIYEDPDDDESEEGGMGLNLFTLFVLLIAAAITIVYYTCTVRTVRVTGNSLYTSEEIAAQVISDDSQLRHNTVFLTALYMTPKAPKIPFEESVKVSLEAYDTILITVKDMDIAGFIPYAGRNLYFSADGIVLENSPLTVKNATFVTGLSITGAEIGKEMTSDDEAGKALILEALQILRKYQMEVESVVLTDSGSVVMYMDKIKVQLGRSDFELKISKISQLLPYLEGRSGTIDLTNYTSADQNIILK